MPQVPYSGTLQVAPQLEPTPRYTADAIPAAFGVNVWQAVEGLGRTADSVGNEIFARGIAMQDLANHSEAQQADADYMRKAGELHADFSSKQGRDAVDSYPQYIQDLQKARSDVRSGLSNGMSQKLFDTQSLSTMGRTVFNGAGHAATQNKVYANQASEARVNAIGDNTLSNPGDDASFRNGLNEVEIEVRAQGGLKGWDQEQINEAIRQRKSWLWSQRIQGMTKDLPGKAREMYEEAVKRGEIRGQDIARLNNLTQEANHTVGARNVSFDISRGANGRFGEGQIDSRAAANAVRLMSGNNYDAIGTTNKDGRELGAYKVREALLPDYLERAGLPNMTPEEFLKNHAAQDQVFNTVFGANMKKTGSANTAASMWARSNGTADPGDIDARRYVTRFNAALAQDAPLSTKRALGQKIAEERTPGDPLMQDAVDRRIVSDHNRQKQAQKDDEFQNRFAIETAMLGGPDGKIPHTEEELKADPKAGQAWDYLVQHDPAVARRYRDLLAASSKGDHAWSEESLRQYQILKGEAQDNPAAFIDRQVIGSKIPLSAQKELVNLQFQLLHRAEGDPRIHQAMSVLEYEGILPSYLISAKKDDPDRLRFIGALSDQLERFATEQKRPPKPEEIKQIGSRLFQQQHSDTFWFAGSTDEMWKLPVPPKTNEIIKQAHPNWTPEQIQKYYTGALYKKLYEKSPTTMVPVTK